MHLWRRYEVPNLIRVSLFFSCWILKFFAYSQASISFTYGHTSRANLLPTKSRQCNENVLISSKLFSMIIFSGSERSPSDSFEALGIGARKSANKACRVRKRATNGSQRRKTAGKSCFLLVRRRWTQSCAESITSMSCSMTEVAKKCSQCSSTCRAITCTVVRESLPSIGLFISSIGSVPVGESKGGSETAPASCMSPVSSSEVTSTKSCSISCR
mmetsp:Transcript_8085/g.20409  ORF Transcript_8085/g.20409 Transcript_8085/m.20409 type:complete len:215 (+) Transcript_8085:456-1100(+)